MKRRSRAVVLALAAALPATAIVSGAAAFASLGAANARPATRSERQAVSAAFAREDGNASQIRAVDVSRSNSSLAVACAKTPEAGTYAYVFVRSHGRWRYTTSGRPGRVGSVADRKLERACT
jgi:hypothetical protein